MDLEANIKVYVDLVHPYKSEQNSKFMEYLFNTMTIASGTEEQLNAYWKQENNMTHCDLTNGLFCIVEICRDCRDDEELKKKYDLFREGCGNITGVIQPKWSGRDPRVPR
jgi:hypothetical protein